MRIIWRNRVADLKQKLSTFAQIIYTFDKGAEKEPVRNLRVRWVGRDEFYLRNFPHLLECQFRHIGEIHAKIRDWAGLSQRKVACEDSSFRWPQAQTKIKSFLVLFDICDIRWFCSLISHFHVYLQHEFQYFLTSLPLPNTVNLGTFCQGPRTISSEIVYYSVRACLITCKISGLLIIFEYSLSPASCRVHRDVLTFRLGFLNTEVPPQKNHSHHSHET